MILHKYLKLLVDIGFGMILNASLNYKITIQNTVSSIKFD